MGKAQCCAVVFLTLAVLALAGGVVFIFVEGDIESALTHFVDTKLMLTSNNNGQLAFDLWMNPTGGQNPVPIYMKFWFFNCTNAEAVATLHATPNLTVVGPYIYRENRWKSNVTWNSNDTEISFGYHVNYTFAADLTDPSLNPWNDTIWAPNLALHSMNALLWFPMSLGPDSNYTWAQQNLAQLAMMMPILNSPGQLPGNYYWQYVERHPNDIFGYTDPLVDYLHTNLGSLMPMSPNISLIPNDNPMYWQNLSSMLTGNNDFSEVGLFKQWAGYRTLPYWNSAEASMLNGTDGTTFSPGLDADSIEIFIDQAGRSIDMTYNGSSSIKGIKTRRYNIDNLIYANSSVVPGNTGFYQDLTPSGVMNVSSFITATGPGPSPAFISPPYFLGGDSSLTENIVLPRAADFSLDTAYLDIEPTTGQLLNAHKLMQVNILAMGDQPYAGLTNVFNAMYNGTTAYLPYFIGDECMEVSDHLASQLKLELGVVEAMHWVGIPICFSLFGIFILLAILCWCRGQRQSEEEAALLAGDTQFGPNSQYTVSGKQAGHPAYGVAQGNPGKGYSSYQ